MHDDAAKATTGGSPQAKGKKEPQIIDEIPKTVPIDTVALQERQKAQRRAARQKRPWIGIVLVVVALGLVYFLFG